MFQHSLEAHRRNIRAEVDGLTKGPQRRYPGRLRQQITEYAQERIALGSSRWAVGDELGVSDPTLLRLLAEASKQPKLRPVRVVAEVSPAPQDRVERNRVVVRAPGGLVIEGLDLGGIVALARALG